MAESAGGEFDLVLVFFLDRPKTVDRIRRYVDVNDAVVFLTEKDEIVGFVAIAQGQRVAPAGANEAFRHNMSDI